MSDSPPPRADDWVRAVFPALHDPKVALASLGLMLLGTACLVGAFAIGTRGATRLLGSVGLTALVAGAAWLTTGRIQGIQGALSDISGPVHWIALVSAVGVPAVLAWRLGLLFLVGGE